MKTILIAEDNDINYFLFQEILSDMDLILIRAVDGIEAVEICKSNSNIDLILMDINMKTMNGIEAAELINNICPDIPIIAQTAYESFGIVKEDKRKYFVEFMTKPLDVPNLKFLINKYCHIEN